MSGFQTLRRNALFRRGSENPRLSGGKAEIAVLQEFAMAKRDSGKLLKMEETH